MRSIRGLIFPQEGIFFELLEKQSKSVLKGAVLLNDLTSKFDHKASIYRKKMKEIEHEADDIVHEIHTRLNTSFITPIDHEDISHLSTSYDDVLDFMYATVNRIFIYDIKRIDETMKEIAQLILESCRQLDKAFGSMKKLSQKEIEKHFVSIHEIESKTDEIVNEAMAKLFRKKRLGDILKYKELYEILEETTDKCEDVVDILRAIVLKHS